MPNREDFEKLLSAIEDKDPVKFKNVFKQLMDSHIKEEMGKRRLELVSQAGSDVMEDDEEEGD